ncbi:MAG: adenine deaminase [Erysipelotrichaceae bacterium]
MIKDTELVLKNANVLNVFTNEIVHGDIAIQSSKIIGIGEYTSSNEIDLNDQYVIPGLIDGHIHIESSMVSVAEFEKAVLPHGTTCVITDPHEIANVAGIEGIKYMMEEASKLELQVKFTLPSCVPATSLDETGAKLNAKDLEQFYADENVVGLAEMMNSYGTILGDKEILEKIGTAKKYHKVVDGHAPMLVGEELNAYICAGVQSDHECATIEEAKEKLAKGQWIMIREGTAAHNLEALMPLFQYPYNQRSMLVSDDKHPQELIHKRHIDYIIREAIKRGADPIEAIKMATINPATYFKLEGQGAIAPGYQADLVVVDNLKTMNVSSVYIKGKRIENKTKETEDITSNERVMKSFRMEKVTKEEIKLENIVGSKMRVIELIPNELLTNEVIVEAKDIEGYAFGVNPKEDILKAVVFERHNNTHHIGIGFIKGYGLKDGAVGTSVAHDSHNLLVVGTNDEDIVNVANAIIKAQGGLAISVNSKITSILELPIAGLMSNKTLTQVENKLEQMKEELYNLGVSKKIDPFMSLSFISLPVIPTLRLNTLGLIETQSQTVLKLFIDKSSNL